MQNHQNLLSLIENDQRSLDLLKSMPNIDTETLCYIIENDLSRSDYEKLLSRPLNPEDRKAPPHQFDEDDDSLIISPTNDLTFLN